MNNKINQKKKIFIGIEFLRIYLSILVVNTHCYKLPKNSKFLKSKLLRNNLHVPIFYIISFFFFQNTLLSRNLNKFKQRFQRLLIPYIFWPVIIWSINNIIFLVFKINFNNSFYDLKNQLLTGHCFNTVFWFQWNLIFETFFFIIIELVFHKYIINILIYIGFTAYYFQYSGYNYNIFIHFDFNLKYTLGRFAEVIPYSISGFYLSYFKLVDCFKKNIINTIFICLLVLILFSNYNFIIYPKGFGYQGFKSQILSFFLFIIFCIISKNFVGKNIFKIIIQISKFTPGIYYLHIPIMNYFKNFFLFIKNKQLQGAMLIYFFCYIICIIGSFIFRKTKLIKLFQ